MVDNLKKIAFGLIILFFVLNIFIFDKYDFNISIKSKIIDLFGVDTNSTFSNQVFEMECFDCTEETTSSQEYEFECAKCTNPMNYEYVINPKFSICGTKKDKKIKLMAFVIISPQHFERRNKIRSSWGNVSLINEKEPDTFRLIFSLALSTNEAINEMVKNESKIYKDILQIGYNDSYYNLTTKVMLSFKWVAKYCSNSIYVIRMNDDIPMNTFGLIKFLNTEIEYKNNTLICYVLAGGPVPRSKNSKFYISFEQFNRSNFDTYCEGSAYVVSTDLTKTIYNTSLNVYWFPFSVWLEDVYIGILIKNLSPRFINIANKYIPIGGQYAGWSKEAKANLLKSNMKNSLFVYAESENHNYFWDLFNNKTLK